MNQIIVINRGIPGSGKSSLLKVLKDMCETAGVSFAVHSTDEKFMVDGEYMFDQTKLGHYHKLNKQDFEDSVKGGVEVVVCDNTNLRQREYNAYVKIAREAGASVVAVVFHPDDYDKHVERNTHGVPEEAILRMMGAYANNIETVGVDHEFVIYPEKFSVKRLQTVSSRILEFRNRSEKDAE